MRISDWSSDVCSSDLQHVYLAKRGCPRDDGLKASQHRIGACAATDGRDDARMPRNRQLRETVVVTRQHQYHAVDPFGVEKRRQRPFDQRAAMQRQILLGATAGHARTAAGGRNDGPVTRSEEHTSELQSL